VSPALGNGPEFDRIRAIIETLGERASGLGDDCALVPLGNEYLAISTDLSIENVHFKRAWLDPQEIGWRAAAGALSDLAAVGAEPIGVLASLALPVHSPVPDFAAVMDGIGAAAAAVGAKVIGGDLASSPNWTVDVTVIGRSQHPVRRSGAQAGDGLWVTGYLGGARAGLSAFTSGQSPAGAVRDSFVHPVPRMAAGRWLAQHGARAMIDLSDGLAGDARHLAAASEVAIVIEMERIPLGPGVQDSALAMGEDPFTFAARGGEDYELLLALAPGFSSDQATEFEQAMNLPLTRIGTLSPGRGLTLTLAGRPISLGGFNHFT
jgi:thiamine-monophosphate kinase